jgi:hypothetical protein
MPAPHTGSLAARSLGHRLFAVLAALFVAATGMLFGPAQPALAAPAVKGCSVEQWQDPAKWAVCTDSLAPLGADEQQCVKPPTPEAPDSGMAGWFVSKPTSAPSAADGFYTRYGYAGYDYDTYGVDCVQGVTSPESGPENTVANVEFMFATGIIGAANALREKAWNPESMWGWADTLVQSATTSIYTQVFTVFGSITLAIVGLYLLWRSRQSDMSTAMTTAGWAILVMVGVTAIAAWPVRSAHLADQSLMAGLSTVHSAIGPPADNTRTGQCAVLPNAAQCVDHRLPAQRASDDAVNNLIYRNWLRGELGSSDAPVAQKYGTALYDAKSLTWAQSTTLRANPSSPESQQIVSAKQQQWERIAKQIKTEDPEAYQYLQGTKAMDRIGAGFIAILSAAFFAMFDLTASILVLLGFLIFRWAVIVAPVLGTIGMLRPASAGIRRLVNSVVAAIFNIIIFGTGAAIYLFAVDLIMGTATLPGWLQVTLVWLCGIVGWLLLRPYRRITQLGGKDSTAEIARGGWHRRFLRDTRDISDEGLAGKPRERVIVDDRRRRAPFFQVNLGRPEARREDPVQVRGTGPDTSPRPEERQVPGGADQGRPVRAPQWTEPEHDEPAKVDYVVYRPASTRPAGTPTQRPSIPRPETHSGDPVGNSPAHRPESAPIRG